jgi:AraC-like DNA-binding protein
MTRAEPGQSYLERRPAAALASFVASVWVQRVEPGAARYTHRTAPNGSVELRCRIGDEAEVIGPRSRPAVDILEPGATVIGMRFRPGADVLGVDAPELLDQTVGAADLWGGAAAELGERVAESRALPAALAELETQIARRFAERPEPDPLVAEAVRRLMPWRTTDVGSLPTALHISERQLRRRCLAAVGLGPKVLQRMLRFQGFLALVQHGLVQGRSPAADGLARLAAEAGYADQSHLTHETVRLMGITPSAFLDEAIHQCAPGHDHRASFIPLLQRHPRA